MAEAQNPGASLESRMGPIPDSAPVGSAVTTEGNVAVTTEGNVAAPAEEQITEELSDLIESNYEVAVKLVNLQGDPNSPLYSVKRFEDLGM